MCVCVFVSEIESYMHSYVVLSFCVMHDRLHAKEYVCYFCHVWLAMCLNTS